MVQSRVFVGSTPVLSSESTHHDELALLLMSQRCAVVVGILSTLLCACAEDALSAWPGARRFHGGRDRQWSGALALHWPVSECCAENGLLTFTVAIAKVGHGKLWKGIGRKNECIQAKPEQV